MKRIILLLVCLFALSGCSAEKKYERTVFSMDTHITMTAYGKNADEALNVAEAEIKRINEKYSIEGVAKSLTAVDDETEELLNTARMIKENTEGAFDINIAPVMSIWGFYSDEFTEKNYRVPQQEEIDRAIAEIQEGKSVDLGGIAKGYCADRVVSLLKEKGVKSAVLSLGGNVALIGKSPEGKDWAVGIQNPFDGGVYATVFVSDRAVVTSGDYIRFFEQNGKKYHHILNPATGYPAENELTSVTVITDSGTYADGLSTALFVMGKEKAEEYWQKNRNFEMVLITKDGKIHCTENVNIQTDKEINITK